LVSEIKVDNDYVCVPLWKNLGLKIVHITFGYKKSYISFSNQT